VDKPKELNPQIQLDSEAMDPHSPSFVKPDGWTKEDISFYFDRALKVLNTENFTTAKEYIDLLVNQCLAERHWSDAFTHFLTKIKEMGLEIETDQLQYENLASKLFYWRTVRMMIHAAGLIRYEEEILKYEIAKFYAPPPPILPPPRTREVPVVSSRPRRADEKAPRESILNPKPKPKPAAAPAPVRNKPKSQPIPDKK
jgi:hypothetical protein